MTPQQREAALRLADDMDTPISVWADQVAHLLRELAAEPVINHKMTTEPAEPHYTITWDAQGRRLVNGELAPEHRTAKPAQQPQGEPVAWHVCSVNSDGSLSLEFAAPWEELAHEHVNDAINEHDIDGAASWVVRPVYASPQPQQTEPSQNTHPPQQRKPPREQITAAAKALCRQASTACNVDFDDNWKVYGDDYIADATAALNAAYGIGEAP